MVERGERNYTELVSLISEAKTEIEKRVPEVYKGEADVYLEVPKEGLVEPSYKKSLVLFGSIGIGMVYAGLKLLNEYDSPLGAGIYLAGLTLTGAAVLGKLDVIYSNDK